LPLSKCRLRTDWPIVSRSGDFAGPTLALSFATALETNKRRLMAEQRDTSTRRLEACEETVRHLEEENRELRDAAGTFGQLAERLNSALRKERREAVGDRRRTDRYDADRRQSAGAARRVDSGQ
jgi:predicted RNase H-like nuclease (RuvC/YqgF family)